MSKELKIKEIKNIAQKLDWPLNDTKNAILEFKQSKTFVNHDDFLRLCLNSKNPKERISSIAQFLVESFPNEIYELIDDLLEGNPLITAIYVFNYMDCVNNGLIELKDCIEGIPSNYSLIEQDDIIIAPVNIGTLNSYFLGIEWNISGNTSGWNTVYMLCDEIIGYNLNGFYNEKENIILLEKLFLKYDFLLLNIPSVIAHLTYLKTVEYVPENKYQLSKFKDLIIGYDTNINRNKITERQYLFYYCLIEEIKKKGYRVLTACRLAAASLSVQYSALKTRYYETKSKLKKENAGSLQEMIQKHNFRNEIDKKIHEIESSR